jgi:hypothetical protein
MLANQGDFLNNTRAKFMVLDGARIYSEGIVTGTAVKSKIRQMVHAIKSLSPSSEISMKFTKCGRAYEGMVWGTINGTPIGVYNRGPSIALVLEIIFRTLKVNYLRQKSKRGASAQPLQLAG